MSERLYKVVGYYGEWDRDCSSCVKLAREPFGDLTSLIYAFATPVNDACRLDETAKDAHSDFPVLRTAKRDYPGLRVLLSIGGADATQFGKAVSSASRIHKLVENCMTFIRVRFPGVFDGIDIDWEHPANPIQRNRFSQLVAAFRTALGATAPLTAAVTPYFSIDWKTVDPELSWINLMAYDIHGPWERRTDFVAPVSADPSDPQHGSGNSVTAYIRRVTTKLGVPAAEIVLGIPFYGYGYTGVSATRDGLYQKYTNTYGAKANEGTVGYGYIVTHLKGRHGFTTHGPDPYSKESWLYRPGARGGVFVSYDDKSSVAAKAGLIVSDGLGGAMIWDIALDSPDPNSSLLAALHDALP